MNGVLHLVSVGPGDAALITPQAQQAIAASEVVVGYGLYLRWIAPWLAGKEVIDLPLTQERERADLAIAHARQGRQAALVSSGDIGIYALASLAFDAMREDDVFEVQVYPGVTAATACASLLGAPLAHDFATLSLSDLLCPWEWIEQRARAIAQADLACVLYNVQSQARQTGVYRILDILRQGKGPDTLCGVVRNAYRPEQSVRVATLAELQQQSFDMLTSLVIGNRHTRRKRRWIYTPRGYHGWEPGSVGVTPAHADPVETGIPVEAGCVRTFEGIERYAQRTLHAGSADVPPAHAVWVYSGTADGNALARYLVEQGLTVALSAATAYGAETARRACPGLYVAQGLGDVEVRARWLKERGVRAIVDATHPHAAVIKPKLMALAEKLGVPYLRYERAPTEDLSGTLPCATIADAAQQAVALGKHIFLSTGSKDLALFLNTPGAGQCQWYARLTPDPDLLRRAEALGMPRKNLCAMQGPISQGMNEALWRDWGIDCVVSKDSGDVGGFTAKAAAARALGIPLLVVRRPLFNYPYVTGDMAALWRVLAQGG
ncbi:MAG: precorrin-3B C(17)-methyltransferase [Methylococcaceae bacterium]|nr:MAG: precorrin-3B C(17)-methyltransferase [Methylococcaceae bacterium]